MLARDLGCGCEHRNARVLCCYRCPAVLYVYLYPCSMVRSALSYGGKLRVSGKDWWAEGGGARGRGARCTA